VDASQTSKLLEYALQQGPAFAVLVAIALVFGFAVRKLFADAKEERAAAAAVLATAQADCREERRQDRAELGAHLDKMGVALEANTRVIERLIERISARGAAA